MRKGTRESGISLAEVLIAMAGSIIIIGVLTVGSIGLQKSFNASESYANSQADERRLVDYVARDLRRAVGISVALPSGLTTRVTTGAVALDENTALIVTLPAYYRSNSATAGDFDQALPVVAAGDRLAYGNLSGPAPEFPVSFRKIFVAAERAMCFVRDEGDTRQIVVRGAEDLKLEIVVAPDGASCALYAQFITRYSRTQCIVAVHDQVMLRNARID